MSASCSNTMWIRGSVVVLALSFASAVQAQTARSAGAAPARGGATGTQVDGRAESSRAVTPVSPLERRVSLDLHDVRLEAALEAVDRQAKLGLSYTARLVPLDRRVSITVDSATVREVLDRLLRGTGVQATVTEGGTVMLERHTDRREEAAPDTTERGAIYGRVVDSATSRPVVGAIVTVKGTPATATTNDSGYFLIARLGMTGLRTVMVRHLGYRAAEKVVMVPAYPAGARVDFALTMSMTRLNEMVTTATGRRRRLEVPNDITVIDVDSVMATAPVHSVTDLLEARVPGLTVQHTSGAPGDPSRLRLRGVSSIYGNNDPVVIVDGVRVYAAQSDGRSGNLASDPTSLTSPRYTSYGTVQFAAPSPLDQIDPHSIETIEVVKGPSAATLYGPDAANGVIVITTKKGHAGPSRWSFGISQGLSYVPGRYPKSYFRRGHSNRQGFEQMCPVRDFTCTADSLVRFQALNDPALTVLDHGQSTSLSLGVSGGTSALTYSLTGSWLDETGLLRLPTVEAARYRALHGSPPPGWMQRPQTLTRWSGTSNLTAQIGSKATATLVTRLTRERQQRSTLEQQLTALMSTFVDEKNQLFYQATGAGAFKSSEALVPDFYRRATDAATNFTNSATLQWRPRTWLTTNAVAGLNIVSRQDAVLLPPGMLANRDSIGSLSTARGNTVVSTVRASALASAPLPLGFTFRFALGADFRKSSIADLRTAVRGLPDGTTGLNGAGDLVSATENVQDETTYGWFVAPSFTHQRFSIDLGLRLDGGSTYGSNVHLPAFPKLGGSWLISGESWFPFKSVFNMLRLRATYGQAGVQPGVADRLRLYSRSQRWNDGSLGGASTIETLGNTQIRPERSTELEGGFDADLLDDRLSVSLTGHRNLRKDALIHVPLAPSVYGSGQSIWKNVGVVRNTGIEMSLTTQLLRTDPLTWSSTVTLSRERNTVVSLAPGVEPFTIADAGRIAPGYPLFGRWTRPVRGYADANGNGVIEENEVQLGDTAVFMGPTMPGYQATLSSMLSLFRGAVTVNAMFDYQDGLTQVNQTAKRNSYLSPAMNDPSAPFGEQAAAAVMDQTDYGITQTVSTLRFNSLSVAFNASPSLARRVGARSLSISLQGSNLGLFTNYTGKDPNVNAYATGNGIADTGQLPLPRFWQLSVRLGY